MKPVQTTCSGQGYSLLELLVALALSALLVALAIPSFEQQLLRSRRTLAAAHLQLLQLRQEQFRLQRQRYAPDLLALGLPDPHGLDAAGRVSPLGDDGAVYRIELHPSGEQVYDLLAVPMGGQVRDRRCGALRLDHLGQRSSSGSAQARDCW